MKKLLSIFFLFYSFYLLPAVEITIPCFEMVTLGRMQDDDFRLATAVSVDINLTGGYKYGLSLGFSFDSPDLAKTLAYRNYQFSYLPGDPGLDPVLVGDYNDLVDKANNLMNSRGTFTFRTIKATVKELFKLPLEFVYFVGEGDNFCSGDEFTYRFGSDPIGTYYHGLFYFPDGIGGDISRSYNGIYGADGTGISLALTMWDFMVPMIYVYENFPFLLPNSNYSEIYYSGDLRFLLNHKKFKMDIFWGMSYKNSMNMRAGLLTHFFINEKTEFLFQGGISGWDLDNKLNIDNFFFLMEPRFRFGIFSLYGTLFYHPVIYHNIATVQEQGKTDINLKFFVQIPNSGISTGIEANMGLKINKMEDFVFRISPFFSFLGSGIQWDAKVRLNLRRLGNPKELFEFFMGISTSF